ncbi:thermonuclease family protein [Sedimenticola sp.]|uniref:thermonuclease family protein n=1 Tax=Sedimenticola sp. TaxID=1940285 RepID=UPI0025895704|nr:thermonuclease family protein [Sedimenticola sp.]MCW8905211.1 thermonuclease family protein [Sedimenticola sp.]
MKQHVLLLASLVAWGPIALSQEGARYPLVAVEDGDTITVQVEGEIKRLQLAGIDAPEDLVNPKLTRDQGRTGLSSETLLALGNAATTHLKQLLSPGDEVQVVGDLTNSDRYGRIPVFAYKDKHSLNAAMVADGYAIVLQQSSIAQEIKTELSALQLSAQGEKRGLWGSHNSETTRWSGL